MSGKDWRKRNVLRRWRMADRDEDAWVSDGIRNVGVGSIVTLHLTRINSKQHVITQRTTKLYHNSYAVWLTGIDSNYSCILHGRDGPKFGRRIRPNVRLGSARQHVTIRPNFGRTLAKIRRHFCGVLCPPLTLNWSHSTANSSVLTSY